MKKNLFTLPFCLLLVWFSSCSDLDRTDPQDLNGVSWLENNQESSSATASSSSAAALSSADSYSSSQALSSSIKPSSSSLSSGFSSSSKASSSSALSSASSSSLGASSSSSSSISFGTVVIGSRPYNTVIIGNQTWMAENLKEGRFVDASLSDPVNTGEGQVTDSLEKYCFNNSEQECESRGGLYTWAEAKGYPSDCNAKIGCTSISVYQGICPDGWHLPSKTDFTKLIEYAGGMDKAGAMLKAYSGNPDWDDAATNFNNPLGFGAIGAGFYHYESETNKKFAMNGGATQYWTADESEYQNDMAYLVTLARKDSTIGNGEKNFLQRNKLSGSSVRCIKN